MSVFITTAAWSLWAYIWLFIMLILWTPDIITVVEAVLTIGFLVILIVQAYAVDVYWEQTKQKAGDALKNMGNKTSGTTRRLVRAQNGEDIDAAAVQAEIKA